MAGNAGPTLDGFKALGPGLKSEFPFDPEWTNLNHGKQRLTTRWWAIH